MRTIGIASGKGGVGKTTVSVNLAVALTKANYRVMLIDGDFGLANIQLALGLQTQINVGHLLRDEKHLQEIIVKTPEGLHVIPGASGISSLANLTKNQINRFIEVFSEFKDPLDFLIVDVAAGLSDNVLALLTACQETIIVVRDEPSSIADAYGIIKVLKDEHDYQAISILANHVTSPIGGESLHHRLNNACIKFLSLNLPLVGTIEEDNFIVESSKKYQPVVSAYPSATATSNFKTLAKSVATKARDTHKMSQHQFFSDRIISE